MSDSLRPYGLYSPWNSPGQNTGVGSLFPLWEIFPTQRLNPGLLHCRWILYQLSCKGNQSLTFEWLVSKDVEKYKLIHKVLSWCCKDAVFRI